MAFDPKKHVIRVQGNREYLPASARLVWFRQEHPDWGIVTSPVEINLAPAPELKRPPYAIFMAQIFNAEGKLMATAHKYEDVKGFPDFMEKAETGAISRALSYCGFGTQFAPELEEGSRLADAPRGGGGFATGSARPMVGGNFGNRPNSGMPGPSRPAPMNGGGGRPMNGRGGGEDPRDMGYNGGGGAPDPFADQAPRGRAEDDPFAEEAPAPAPRAAAAPAPPPAAAPPRAEGRPAPSGAAITRVKEPERDYDDPGGPDMDEEGDPFADEAAPPAPARPAARPTAAASAPAAEAGPAPKPKQSNNTPCSVDGCSNVLLPNQVTISMNKFGKALCLLHQRDAQPAGGGNGGGASGAGGGARRGSRPEPQDALL